MIGDKEKIQEGRKNIFEKIILIYQHFHRIALMQNFNFTVLVTYLQLLKISFKSISQSFLTVPQKVCSLIFSRSTKSFKPNKNWKYFSFDSLIEHLSSLNIGENQERNFTVNALNTRRNPSQ